MKFFSIMIELSWTTHESWFDSWGGGETFLPNVHTASGAVPDSSGYRVASPATQLNTSLHRG
jgi:hypothetical protein